MAKPERHELSDATEAAGAPWRVTPTGLEVHVRLTPRGGFDKVEGAATLANGQHVLKVRVRAVPEDGQANKALLRLLAGFFGCPASALTLVAGATARVKTVVVAGNGPSLAAQLEALAVEE